MKDNRMTRFLAMLLSLMMLLGCTGISALAEDFDEPVAAEEIPVVVEEIPAETDGLPAEADASQADEEQPPVAAESPAVEEPSPAAEAEFPAAEDATEEEEKPAPAAFTGSVTAELQNKGEIFEGDTLVFLAKVTGDASLVTIRWQAETEENVWKDLASGERFALVASAETLSLRCRVALFDAAGNIAAAAAPSRSPAAR